MHANSPGRGTEIQTIRFDPQYRARAAELSTSIKCFIDWLTQQELQHGLRTRARSAAARRNFNLAAEALCCNLLLLSSVDNNTALAVPRSHGFIWAKGRYKNPVYGQHFLDLIDSMASFGLIAKVSTGYRINDRRKAPSLITVREALAEHLPIGSFDWRWIKLVDEPEVIILKEGKDEDGRAGLVEYSDGKNTIRWRKQINHINASLQRANIEIAAPSIALHIGGNGHLIIPYRRSVRRIFNNATWQHGGRLAGGFWMSMKREDRFRQLRIDGELVADVDYRQLFPRLAYVRAQADQPSSDIYDVTGDGSSREGWKTLFNALLFAEGRLGNWPSGCREHFREGIKLREAIDLLKRKHAPIANLFETRIGFQLMRIESDMLVAVVTHLLLNGITALPLHDAVLVARSNAEAAKQAMQHEFELRSGSRCAIVSVDFDST
jgi:hypothetical protein